MPATSSDVAFSGCATHPVCQDYGLAGARAGSRPFAWAVAADGCSSEPHTDVGARLLLHAAARQVGDLVDLGLPLYHHGHAMGWVQSVAHAAAVAADAMRLPDGALCATLLAVATDAEGHYRTLVAGDGVVAARKRRTGEITVQRYRFANEMPFYPLYLTDRRCTRRYAAAAGPDCLTARCAVIDPDPARPVRWLEQRVLYDCYPYTATFHAGEYDAVAVLTDGADALRRPAADGATDEPVPLEDVVRELLAFKTTEGAFVQRRFKRGLKAFAERGWTLGDDLACAAVSAALPVLDVTDAPDAPDEVQS